VSFENKRKCQKINGNKRRKGLVGADVDRDVGLERNKKVGLNKIIFHKMKSSTASGLNFINILCATYTLADRKSIKRY